MAGKGDDDAPDLALVLGGPMDDEDDLVEGEEEEVEPEEPDGLSDEQEMLAEKVGWDSDQAMAVKQFIKSCRDEY